MEPARRPTFAVVVRTQGSRPQSLREALESLTFQRHPTRAVVVVHGGEDVRRKVEAVCGQVDRLDFQLLAAGDEGKKRGYPMNVGLEYCRGTAPGEIDFLFFLDDDDIVYPFFTQMMSGAFVTSEADVVYAASNRREGEEAPGEGYRPRSVFNLLYENCIAINSFAIRLEKWRGDPVYFDEQYECLEDWKFLVGLLEKGYRFEAYAGVVSEFRTDARQRYMQPEASAWKRHALEVRGYINRALFRIPGAKLVGVVAESEPRLGRMRDEMLELKERKIAALEQRVYDLEHSWSWRMTGPMRAVVGWGLKLARGGRPLKPQMNTDKRR